MALQEQEHHPGMSYVLFLDDVRDPNWVYPDSDVADWVVCRSFDEAVAVCEDLGCPSEVSFDHDLGDGTPTGYDFAHWLISRDMDAVFFPKTFKWHVHSANPVGAENIRGLLECYFQNRGTEK